MRRDGETRVPRRYGAVKPRRAAPPRRDTLVLAHVRCESSVDLTKLSQPPVNSRVYFWIMTELTVIT